LDRLDDRRSPGKVLRTEDLEPDHLYARGHAADLDQTRGRMPVGRNDEVIDVVGPVALRGDRPGVDAGFSTAGRGIGPLSGDVLVVDEHMLAVRTNELWVVDVESIGHIGDTHALAGNDVLRLRDARIGEGGGGEL